MPSAENSTEKTLAELGVRTPEAVSALFAELRERANKEQRWIDQSDKFEQFRVKWVGRKSGILTQVTENWLKPSDPELKRIVGQVLNEFRTHLQRLVDQAQQDLDVRAGQAADARERIDLSLPGVIRPIGSHHLIRQVFQEIEDIFFSIGFSVVEGPEIETPYYNFEALNIPEFHSVRDDMDTFYLDLPKGAAQPLLLRTHTSPMQIRTMEKRQPPVRVIVPGKVYRRDNPDATHSFMFHQV